MLIKTNYIPYKEKDADLEGFLAYSKEEKCPLVILCHAWAGRDDFILEKANLIAKLGYVGFALDIYGRGILGRAPEENARLKKPFLDDRLLLQKRLLKAFEIASSLPQVDATKIAVLGFGFGGLCALDLARSGVPLKGAVSIYGHYNSFKEALPIKTKVLLLHGYNDPISTLDELFLFQTELEKTKVDWQSHLFSNSFHAFATPSANNPTLGILYNPLSAKRAWEATQNFLNEIFGSPHSLKSDVTP